MVTYLLLCSALLCSAQAHATNSNLYINTQAITNGAINQSAIQTTNQSTDESSNSDIRRIKSAPLSLDVIEQQNQVDRSKGLQYAKVIGYIGTVFAGSDSTYGMRFYMHVEEHNTDEMTRPCNYGFVYTRKQGWNGHDNKVTIFMSAYLMQHKVYFTCLLYTSPSPRDS